MVTTAAAASQFFPACNLSLSWGILGDQPSSGLVPGTRNRRAADLERFPNSSRGFNEPSAEFPGVSG